MVIGLHGRIGAGKNAAAKRLALLYPDVVEVSFAAKLKLSAAALLGCTVDDLERWKNNRDALVEVHDGTRLGGRQTVRSFLQRYGTESHRDIFGEDFWLDAALPLEAQLAPGGYDNALYVVTDVRFPNEAQRVKDLGGYTVKVIGPDEFTSGHVSELPLECDYGLNNAVRDDGFAALDRNLRQLLDSVSLPVAA